MSVAIEKQLNESLRDAQLGLYLSAIAPQDVTLKALKIAEHLKTADDLYHYWLLDVLVSQDVPTSPVACAIASLQQYINSILANMEPGYHTAQIPADQVDTWRTVMHHYQAWATNQRLYYFPAAYLDPTLRKTRTASFEQLENDLNRNQLTAQSVQTAVLAYLNRLEEVANLKIVNGYIDGSDFANSTYYFIARSRAANTWYWRSLDMACRPFVPGSRTAKYDAPEPQAWSDWHRINLPVSDSTIEHTIRPVMFNNRLYVIWAECIYQDQVSNEDNKNKTFPLFRLNMCFKKYDGSWSTPQTCVQGYGSDEAIKGRNLAKLKEITRTIATCDQSSASLCVVLHIGEFEREDFNIPYVDFCMSLVIDKDSLITSKVLPRKNLDAMQDKTLIALLERWPSSKPQLLQCSFITAKTSAPDIKSRLDRTLGTTEFIDFKESEITHSEVPKAPPRQPIRMNITFARHLIERAEDSMDTLLSWSSQHLQEPPLEDGKPPEQLDFYGAYGRYFVELFLYLPWLVAHRFNQERQYGEAERWLHYLFNPARKAASGSNPDYWNAVPVITGTSSKPGQPSYALQGPQDPHQIALSHPVHFRKALYMLYLDILLNRGDTAYRQLSPDSLTDAKLWYLRAQDLLGPRPDIRQTDLWATLTLKAFSEEPNTKLREFENTLGEQGMHLPTTSASEQVPPVCIRPYVHSHSGHAIDAPHSRLPFNPVLLPRWEKLESRLHNLRHNLDIVGRPLRLALFAAPAASNKQLGANPARAAEPGLAQRLGTEIPPYRFSTLHAHAQSAVDTVIQFGETLMSFIERSEQASYQELQQQHIWDIATLAVDLQTQALKIDQKNREALLASKAIVENRRDYYGQLVNEVVNQEEVTAAAFHLEGRIAEAGAHAAHAGGQGLKVVPNIFGLADGGARLEGGALAMMAMAQGVATAAYGTGEALERAAQYRRRHQDWTLARDQAKLEIAQIDAQLAVEVERETASRLLLQQTQTSLAQARTAYTLLSQRFTNSQLYQWFTHQLSSFYYQVYDSTFSLCQFTERSWRYETADSTTQAFFQNQSWNSTYRGLGPGERMKLGLMKMKNAWLLGNERELEIRKTVSLRVLHAKEEVRESVTDTSASASKQSINKPWEDIKSTLIKNGSCEFELTETLFEDDYPGHRLRRIKSISISLPAVLGPYEDIRATLTQTSSEVFLPGPDKKSMKNLRANQQIALSTGVDDSGLFTLSFQDERYLPFEYTGAISKWQLSFTNHTAQKSMLESLTDIIVHVQYTARATGGAQ
ncbi:neuraminidase-like domain-containing protein [Pseudomonas sp. FP1742]|uniref:Tc toxin subunit A-related protein n=1 Tax=Pseudomonas sp. FP1742 TaxID=2954079 RepID=UPI0027373455|nr:neuraminidase-like domain-containing protein [Pseudomonas sp. FP1742]WLG51635.1 neuraminidase-like domain-containing protein [Pseudomonas sp. FP1742]